MRLGTKTLLFGAHQLLLHPLFVAAAWSKLYGPPLDPRLWIAFFVHDLGYFGKPNLDGQEGKTHPELGARIMHKLFGAKWRDLCLYHSRSAARQHGQQPSLLSYADKLSTLLVPRRLYLRQIHATGEVEEYLQHFHQRLEAQKNTPVRSGVPDVRYPPLNIAYGSIEHWYWAITRRYTPQWIQAKQRELQPQVKQFRLRTDNA
jgi:hypothetical protein